MISDFSCGINIIKQQFTCLLLGNIIKLFSFIALSFIGPNGTDIKLCIIHDIQSSFSFSVTWCFSIGIQTYIQNVGGKCTHTRIQTYKHSSSNSNNSVREKEKESNTHFHLHTRCPKNLQITSKIVFFIRVQRF